VIKNVLRGAFVATLNHQHLSRFCPHPPPYCPRKPKNQSTQQTPQPHTAPDECAAFARALARRCVLCIAPGHAGIGYAAYGARDLLCAALLRACYSGEALALSERTTPLFLVSSTAKHRQDFLSKPSGCFFEKTANQAGVSSKKRPRCFLFFCFFPGRVAELVGAHVGGDWGSDARARSLEHWHRAAAATDNLRAGLLPMRVFFTACRGPH
jgi:hypothetical protein